MFTILQIAIFYSSFQFFIGCNQLSIKTYLIISQKIQNALLFNLHCQVPEGVPGFALGTVPLEKWACSAKHHSLQIAFQHLLLSYSFPMHVEPFGTLSQQYQVSKEYFLLLQKNNIINHNWKEKKRKETHHFCIDCFLPLRCNSPSVDQAVASVCDGILHLKWPRRPFSILWS